MDPIKWQDIKESWTTKVRQKGCCQPSKVTQMGYFFIHNTNLGNMCQYTEKWWVIHVYQSSFGRLFIPDCFVTPELLESWWIYIYIYIFMQLNEGL